MTTDMQLSRMTSRRSFLSLTAGVIVAPFIGRASIASSAAENRTTRTPNRYALALPLVNPSIVVTKSKRLLRLYSAGKAV
jgi:hypothetical protein